MAIHILRLLQASLLTFCTLMNTSASEHSGSFYNHSLRSQLQFSTTLTQDLFYSESLPAFVFSWPNNNGTLRVGESAAIDVKVLGNIENASDFKPILTVNGKPGNSCYVSGVGLERYGEGPISWKIVFVPIRVGLFNVIVTEDLFRVLDSSLHFEALPGSALKSDWKSPSFR